MLKISIKESADQISLDVEGRLAGPWVEELQHCWEAQLERKSNKPLYVRLCAVSFIDDAGQSLLTRMVGAGAKLEGNGCLVRAIIAKILGAFRPAAS